MQLQYLNLFIKLKRPVWDRFAVMFSIAIAWLFAQILTSSSVYNKTPENTQISCRTDRAGLLSSAPWSDQTSNLLHWYFCWLLVYGNMNYKFRNKIFHFLSFNLNFFLSGYIFLIHFNGEAPQLMQVKLLQWWLPLLFLFSRFVSQSLVLLLIISGSILCRLSSFQNLKKYCRNMKIAIKFKDICSILLLSFSFLCFCSLLVHILPRQDMEAPLQYHLLSSVVALAGRY